MLLLSALSVSFAGQAQLQNDDFSDGDQASYQTGFVRDECFATVFVPEDEDYPFTLTSVDLLYGGAASNGADYIMTVGFHQLDDEDMSKANAGTGLGEEGVGLADNTYVIQRITIEDLEIVSAGGYLSDYEFEWGNPAVFLCFTDDHPESGSGQPGPANDTDGNRPTFAERNYINIGTGWKESGDFGVRGDWIMRLCVDGPNVSGGCDSDADTDSDTDSGTDSDTDSDTDTDTDTDTDVGVLSLESITPDWATEGTPVDVVLLGSGFDGTAEVSIGGLDLTGTDVVNSQTITGRSPSALPVGLHDVEVTTDDGNEYLAGAFEVLSTDSGESEGSCGCTATPTKASLAWLVALGLPFWQRRRRR